MFADRQRDGSAGPGQLGGQLHPCRGGADDEDATVGERVRSAIVERGPLSDGRRERGGANRHERDSAGSGGDENGVGVPGGVVGSNVKAAARVAHGVHGGLGVDGSADPVRVAPDHVRDLGSGEEAVGVGLPGGLAGQSEHPVGCEQTQSGPPSRAPRVGDVTAVEHDVFDGSFAQPVAHREAGVAGADDDGGGPHCVRPVRR